MDQNVKIEVLAQDPVFIKALVSCVTAEDTQQLFAAKGISLSGEALSETCLTLLKCGKQNGALSEDDLLQVAAGVNDQNYGFIPVLVNSIAPYKVDTTSNANAGFFPAYPKK